MTETEIILSDIRDELRGIREALQPDKESRLWKFVEHNSHSFCECGECERVRNKSLIVVLAQLQEQLSKAATQPT